MDVINKTFLSLLKASLLGQPGDPDTALTAEEWMQLFRMAGIHKVLPMVYEAAYRCPSLQQLDPAALAGFKRQVRSQVIAQTVRTDEFLALNRKLREAGVEALVTKGIICRTLYPKPDHRQSADEDILIPPEQYPLCHTLLTEFGMYADMDGSLLADAYEVPYRKAGSPLYIELHKYLFPPRSDAYGDLNRYFADIRERSLPEQIQGETVYTLGYTDHMLYLLCHAFKHFLHSGFGIRQVCDIVLYANRYGSQIDWTLLLHRCREIRADVFAASVFRIGWNYLTFDPDQAAYPDPWRSILVDETAMLDDILSSGIYGSADRSRQHSSSITLEAVSAQKQKKKPRGMALSAVFPPADKLEDRYPYLKKHPWLLPAAWLNRIWFYFRETGTHSNSNAADALRIGSERIALLKQYGILK